MDKDIKQYTDMLKLIGHTGNGLALLNSLNTIEIGSSDPKLKKAAQTIAALIRDIPEYSHRTNLSLLVEAGRAGGMTEHEHNLKDWVMETKKYCEACAAAVEPDWMIQARAAGWTPPTA